MAATASRLWSRWKSRPPLSTADGYMDARNLRVCKPHVAASLRRFGWQQPFVARLSGEVIARDTRLKAAQSLGMTEVPVWWTVAIGRVQELARTG